MSKDDFEKRILVVTVNRISCWCECLQTSFFSFWSLAGEQVCGILGLSKFALSFTSRSLPGCWWNWKNARRWCLSDLSMLMLKTCCDVFSQDLVKRKLWLSNRESSCTFQSIVWKTWLSGSGFLYPIVLMCSSHCRWEKSQFFFCGGLVWWNCNSLPLSCLVTVQLQLGTFVECCVTLLQRPDLLPSALSQSRIVRMLLSFVDNSSRNTRYHVADQFVR